MCTRRSRANTAARMHSGLDQHKQAMHGPWTPPGKPCSFWGSDWAKLSPKVGLFTRPQA